MGNWTNNMKHFLIITNAFKDKNLKLTNEIKGYIEKKGGSCQCFTSTGDDAKHAAPEADAVAPETECVLVLGGDGTLIRAASKLVEQNMALIGVNLGTLGYLCELEESNVFTAVDELMEDRTGALSVVNLIVFVNGEYLNTFRADGIIISTPTGSTGYNMSAGGPIVDPKASMIIITPINAHNLNSRSIVIGAEDEVMIEIGERRSQKDETVEVSFDGDNAVGLEVGDKFLIRKADSTTRICKLNNMSFLEILRKKMKAYT